MLLRDLELPINIATARGLALVFSAGVAARLAEHCITHGSTNCVPTPSLLTDGRLMLSADMLTEIGPGGLLAEMWAHADHAAIGQAVEVLPSDVVAAMAMPPRPMLAEASVNDAGVMPWEA